MANRFARLTAASFATCALVGIQATAATAQYDKGCQYYSVTTCAGDKWQALGYASRGECYSAKYIECEGGGPIEEAISFKPETMPMARTAPRT